MGRVVYFEKAHLVRLEINDLEANWLRQSRYANHYLSCEQALSELGECLSVGPAGEHGVRIASPTPYEEGLRAEEVVVLNLVLRISKPLP